MTTDEQDSDLDPECSWDAAGFATRLARAKGMASTNAFAQKCGISESIFRKYLAGASVPGADKLVDIARVAGVSLLWLATGQGRAEDGTDAIVRGPVDVALLETLLESVEGGLEEIGATLTPTKKAKLVAALYSLYRSSEDVRKAPVLELVRLAS
ncbi:helix-turn-helix domain-containing protein [Thiocapsa bogorovii]|uniref:helix-turn-helix domain-containing protein n=1 Tax=Thiocapsa bogorovii TaxID=521689 RepID=UPI001E4FF823|nr:helix-turn-helix domain-containing protein [Thiocapsa bogorovii]UHD15028.1 helix-turn-helix domain-containing protein [Thiocapsa bogorovii]